MTLFLHYNLTNYFLKLKSIRTKKCLWWPCLLQDQNKMKNFLGGLHKHDKPHYSKVEIQYDWPNSFREKICLYMYYKNS